MGLSGLLELVGQPLGLSDEELPIVLKLGDLQVAGLEIGHNSGLEGLKVRELCFIMAELGKKLRDAILEVLALFRANGIEICTKKRCMLVKIGRKTKDKGYLLC